MRSICLGLILLLSACTPIKYQGEELPNSDTLEVRCAKIIQQRTTFCVVTDKNTECQYFAETGEEFVLRENTCKNSS